MSLDKQDNGISLQNNDMPANKTVHRFLNVNGKQTVIELCVKLPQIPSTRDLLYVIVGKCNIDNLGNPIYHFKGKDGLKDAIEIFEVDCMKRGRMTQMTDYYLVLLFLPNIIRGHMRRKLREFIDHPDREYVQVEVDSPTLPLFLGRE